MKLTLTPAKIGKPRTLELRADLPPADLDDATAFCVGRPCKDGGRVVRTAPGGRVWVARAGSLALVDLGQVILPHSVHAEVRYSNYIIKEQRK